MLAERIEGMINKYPKPKIIQDTFDSAFHRSDAENFSGLESAEWRTLSIALARDLRPEPIYFTMKAWQSIIPALMKVSLSAPYLIWEYEGTLVTEFLTILQQANEKKPPELLEALRLYSASDLMTLRDWLLWCKDQHPNFDKLDDWTKAARIEEHHSRIMGAVARIDGEV